MSNAETPAENTGGTAATPIARALQELPNRVRVHALAKLLGSSSREVLGMLSELGETARSPQSSVTRDVAVKVAETAGAVPPADPQDGAAESGAAAEQAPAEPAPAEQAEASAEPTTAAADAEAGPGRESGLTGERGERDAT